MELEEDKVQIPVYSVESEKNFAYIFVLIFSFIIATLFSVNSFIEEGFSFWGGSIRATVYLIVAYNVGSHYPTKYHIYEDRVVVSTIMCDHVFYIQDMLSCTFQDRFHFAPYDTFVSTWKRGAFIDFKKELNTCGIGQQQVLTPKNAEVFVSKLNERLEVNKVILDV